MSQPTRAERRRGGTPPPAKRDPMRPIYIGIGVLIVLVFVIFGGVRYAQQRQFNGAWATPSPGPIASAKPVQLNDGDKIGAPLMGAVDTKKGADTPSGGHGSPVDGVGCASMEGAELHIHTQLSLFVSGKQVQIPPMIGMTPTAQGGCLYWIHTHQPDGIVHVESPEIVNPSTNGPFTIGNFFDIWGQPLSRDQVGPFHGPVTAFVNGARYDGDLKQIPLMSHELVTLEVGQPVVPPIHYVFPPND